MTRSTNIRIFVGMARGVLVAQCIVAIFMLTMIFFAGVGTMHSMKIDPIIDMLVLWPPIGLFALPIGVVMGLLSISIKRHRIYVLLAAVLIGYLFVSIATVFWVTSSPGVEDIGMIIVLGAWSSVAFGMFTGPPLVLGVFLLEKWNRFH